jgi:hypothetical protein
VNVKNSGGKTTPGGDKGILVTEDYCMELAELVREILNEPQTQQITIVKDQDGNTLSAPIHVYESRADDIIYTYGYNGAIRIAEIPWYGKFYLLGPTNPTPSTIPP